MTLLRQVLNAFENTGGPRTLSQLARDLDVSPGMLEGMIDYWVRRGKLRESSGDTRACATCGQAEGCPFIVRLPRAYELAHGEGGPPCHVAAEKKGGGCPRCG